jgi:hypothetical protein
MRTDLLTGRLSFLSGRWATPAADEPTLLSRCAQAGIRTCLVTDNYIIAVPELQGVLPLSFDDAVFLRGYGSDPWAVPTAQEKRLASKRAKLRPCRNPAFEAQFVANSRKWASAGGPPHERVFTAAADRLASLATQPRFLLWVDSFGAHEPWVSPDAQLDSTIVLPPYGTRDALSEEQMQSLRRAYALRIGDMDRALEPFLDELAVVLSGGDVGLVVLSDHGFLFGEFGAVGKPHEIPLPPHLHSIECRVSANVAACSGPAGAAMQPHDVHRLCEAALFGGGVPTPGAVQVLGRNSPRSRHLTIANEEGMGFLWTDGTGRTGEEWFSWSGLQPRFPFCNQPGRRIKDGVLWNTRDILGSACSAWLAPFTAYLSERAR